tara:strand:- start:278 stop:703 length:426 start_codon:yes stop_codon:yes gene_type:complete
MGAAAIPILLGASTLMMAKSQIDAGKARKIETKLADRQEKMAGRDRQISRNEDLIRSMAKRRVAQAAGGGGAGGSYAAGQRESIRQTELGQLSDDASVAARSQGLRFSGKAASRAGLYGAAGTLLSGGAQVAQAWPGKKKK